MPQPNKKRARELRQDKFRDETLGFFGKLGDRLEGKGRTILYALAGIIALVALVSIYNQWSERRADEARRALGRAIEIAEAPVVQPGASPQPTPPSNLPTFTSERERAERAVKEFDEVANKYSDPQRAFARYFMATNLLILDRNRGIGELEKLSKNSDAETADAAKFALAQARETDGQYDAAINLYNEIKNDGSTTYAPDTINLLLAGIYEKQGKRQEAVNLLFDIAGNGRKAQGADGKPAPLTAAAREAATKLQTLDPQKYAELPPDPTATSGGLLGA